MDLGDVVLLKLAGHPGEPLPDWLSGASLHPVAGTNASFQSSLLLISCLSESCQPRLLSLLLISVNLNSFLWTSYKDASNPLFFSPLPCSLVARMVKYLPAMRDTQEIQVRSLSWENPLEKLMAKHSNILAWRIPWTKEPWGLQPTESQRSRHDWATTLSFKPFLNLKTIFPQRKYTFTLFCRAV